MRIAVVGAGLSGLAAARKLAGEHEVVVLERAASVGGRLSTTQIATRSGVATFDVGAQFFTVRGELLARQTDDWLRRGVVREWCRGFGDVPDGHARYIGSTGMASIAEDLAAGLDVHRGAYVFALHRTPRGWRVVLTDSAVIDADAVLLACPVPQSRALLIQTDVSLPEALVTIDYERTVALLAVLDRPSAMHEPGAVQFATATDDVLTFVADNQRKGISDLPALTCHAGSAWSTEHWDLATDELIERITLAATPWIEQASVAAGSIRKWRLATPRAFWPEPVWVDRQRRVVLAGDAFAGPKFEGAYASGLAAAAAVIELS